MKNNTQNLTFTAMMAALICITGPVVIQIGVVPMSLANMAIYLAIILLDKKKAIISVAVYLLIGFVGIPVFAGFTAGVGKLFGPTGGYLTGYLVLSWVSGSILERRKSKEKAFPVKTEIQTDRKKIEKQIEEKRESTEEKYKEKKNKGNAAKIMNQFLALATGTLVLYFFGTLWLMYQSSLSFFTALSVGVLPFVPFDIIKIIAAILLGNSIKRRSRFLVP